METQKSYRKKKKNKSKNFKLNVKFSLYFFKINPIFYVANKYEISRTNRHSSNNCNHSTKPVITTNSNFKIVRNFINKTHKKTQKLNYFYLYFHAFYVNTKSSHQYITKYK